MHMQPISQDGFALRCSDGDDAGIRSFGDDAAIGSPDDATIGPLDDVFDAGPNAPDRAGESHPSDMVRLQAEHATAGYREGITQGKAATIQQGFDQGFSLGATIGLRVGQLLGVLEGIVEAVQGLDDDAAVEARRLLTEARDQLGQKAIYDAAYWESDGQWKYAVQADAGPEPLFSDVADAHPLVQKWKVIVDGQARVWGLNETIFDDCAQESLESENDNQGAPVDTGATGGLLSTKTALDW